MPSQDLFHGRYVQEILLHAYEAVRTLVIQMELACGEQETPV